MKIAFHTTRGFVLLVAIAVGASVPALPQEFSIDDLWKLTVEHNPSLQVQHQRMESARHNLAIQKAARLPVVSFSGTHSYISEVAQFELPFTFPGLPPFEITAGTHRTSDLALIVQQPLFTGFRLRHSIRAASDQLEAQRWAYRSTAQAVLLQVGQLYYSLQRNLLHQEAMRQALRRADLHLQRARALLEAKQIAPFDTLEVANRRLRLLTQLRGLQHQNEVFLAKLLRVVNVPSLGKLARVDLDTIRFGLQPLGTYQQAARRRRPEFRQLDFLKKASDATVRTVRSALFPQIFASASYHYARPGVNFFRDEWMTYYTVGVSLRWTLWDWRSRAHRVEQAVLARTGVETQHDDLVSKIREEVAEAYQNLLSARDQAELQKQLVRQEKERYRLTRDQFENGQASSLDLSLAETALTAADLGLRDIMIQWLQARLRLSFATGQLSSMISQEDQ